VSLLILSILGTGILVNITQTILNGIKILTDFLLTFFKSLSKNTGEIVNGTGDAVTNTSIFGVEILDGIIHDIGNMFKGQATPVSSNSKHLDVIIQNRDGNNTPTTNVSSNIPHSVTQSNNSNPIPANTGNDKWCFIGKNDNGSSTCTKLQNNQACLSNKIYNSQDECKNQ